MSLDITYLLFKHTPAHREGHDAFLMTRECVVFAMNKVKKLLQLLRRREFSI
jgi:hypothetical protein